MGLQERDQSIFANIIGDGTIRVASTQSDPKAVLRKWELKDGTSGEKYERVYYKISGKIKDIRFEDGKFGARVIVVINDGEDINFCMAGGSNYADDLLKKLPNINTNKVVTFKPYSFEDKSGKLRKGISVTQGENKIGNYFADTEHKPLHGFPVVPKPMKMMKSADWKMYFLSTSIFLQEFTEQNIVPMLDDGAFEVETSAVVKTDSTDIEEIMESVSPEDIM